jgi:hypothetical protein
MRVWARVRVDPHFALVQVVPYVNVKCLLFDEHISFLGTGTTEFRTNDICTFCQYHSMVSPPDECHCVGPLPVDPHTLVGYEVVLTPFVTGIHVELNNAFLNGTQSGYV